MTGKMLKIKAPRIKVLRILAAVLALAAAPPVQARQPNARAMVAAANPLAAQAGLAVLRRGGSAVDAAVAVQAVLGLVEPQSSGLGGGAFMTFYDARSRQVTAYDGRETAPAGASPEMFLDAQGKPMQYGQAVSSGRSAGVPGAVAMLAMAQKDHGRLAWSSLFGDAERLADEGFAVSPRLARAMRLKQVPQPWTPDATAYFTRPDGARYEVGDTLKNPAYAQTVRLVAAQGPKALLEGPLAQAIVAKLREAPIPGTMTLGDLAAYRPKASPGLCRPFRVIYRVCVPHAPSGGPAVLEGLGILERTDIARRRNDAQGWYLFAQASRLMYADRDRYLADPAFVDVPTEGLLDPAYLTERAGLIGPVAGPAPPAGSPKGAGARAPDRTLEPGGTSHMTIVDTFGNVVSMTTTVESIFGDGRMVGGFFLNNQLTDFSYAPTEEDGRPAANAVAPGKRPRSSMAPAIVLDRRGRFVAAVGSPGGPAILAYNLKALTALLAWNLPIEEAVALPNLIARGQTYGAEVDKTPEAVKAGLAARGVTLTSSAAAEDSGLHGIEAVKGGLRGAADPRREGVAIGF